MVKCNPPKTIENGDFSPQSSRDDGLYEYLNAVTYQCNKGFTMDGPATVTCSENNTFHPGSPKCKCRCSLFYFKSNHFSCRVLLYSLEKFLFENNFSFSIFPCLQMFHVQTQKLKMVIGLKVLDSPMDTRPQWLSSATKDLKWKVRPP